MMRYPFHRDSEPAQLQDPGPLAQFQRAWATQGQMPALAEPRVQLGIRVDDLSLPEYWWLRRAHRVMANALLAASAANYSTFQLRCTPGNEGLTMFVVEKIIFFNVTAAAVQLRWNVGPGFNVSTFANCEIMDDRLAGTPNTWFQFGQDNTSAVSGYPGGASTFMTAPIGANSMFVIDNPGIILTGSQSLMVQTAVINQALHLNVFGRERILNPSER